jgi:hypothetical protein
LVAGPVSGVAKAAAGMTAITTCSICGSRWHTDCLKSRSRINVSFPAHRGEFFHLRPQPSRPRQRARRGSQTGIGPVVPRVVPHVLRVIPDLLDEQQ